MATEDGKKIKYIILVISGLSDLPSEQFNGKTPLEIARTRNMDFVSTHGRIGMVGIVGDEAAGGSDQAILSLLGYDSGKYPIRRGPLEAVGLGIELGGNDLALRCNFVSTYKGMLIDHNAGQIGNAEAATLIKMLNARFKAPNIRFYPGSGYRNVLVLKDGASLDFRTLPPHEALHQPVVDFQPYGKDAQFLIDLMSQAHEELANHDINRVRVDLGENPADRIWLWGEGKDFQLPPFESAFPIKGCVISPAPLLKGIAQKIGFFHLPVPGATGYHDTDYGAKASFALRALDEFDLVLVQVGAVNEICHQGNVKEKVRVIEEIDRKLVGPLLQGLERHERWRFMVTTDHITPAGESIPLKWPVPMAFLGHDVDAIREYAFTEENARRSDLYVDQGKDLMEFFLGIKRS